MLAGGSTPKALYELWAKEFSDRLDWSRVSFTFSDERAVPPEHVDSNYRMAKEALFDPLGISKKQVLRLRGEDGAEKGAQKAHKALEAWAQQVPLFDVVLLGLGSDAHTASLFPSDTVPEFGARLAGACQHPDGQPRITLTPQALSSAGQVAYFVSGEGKAQAVASALSSSEADSKYPTRSIGSSDTPITWFLDEAAASALPAKAGSPS